MRQVPLDFPSSSHKGAIRFARLLSDFLSPPAAFAAAGLVTGWLDHLAFSGILWGALYGILASLLPVLFVLYSYKTGKISDMHMSDPAERQAPYLIGLVGAGGAWLLLRMNADAPRLEDLVLCHIAVMIGLTGWNYFKLISAHVASLAAIAIFFGLVVHPASGVLLSPIVVLMFIIRYYLKRHTMAELLLGLATGAAAVGVLTGLGAIQA